LNFERQKARNKKIKINIRTDGYMGVWVGGWMDGWAGGWMEDGWTGVRAEGRTNGYLKNRTNWCVSLMGNFVQVRKAHRYEAKSVK
jgi:hypothetical protein